MKISELITTLENRMKTHGDIEVEIAFMPGVIRSIDTDSIYKSKEGPLYIDAYHNSYKDELAANPDEGDASEHDRAK